MPAYSFKEQFCEPVEEGSKLHTVRAIRVGKTRHAKPGETVYLYFGMRTKWCRKLAEGTCTRVQNITIGTWGIKIDGQDLYWAERDRFAWSDGFRPAGTTQGNPGKPREAWGLMKAFFVKEHGISADPPIWFDGVIIHWTLKHKAEWKKA